MDSQQLGSSKRKCLLQSCQAGNNEGTNVNSYEVRLICPFFNEPEFSDVTLNINGRMDFYVHKVILASKSEFFKELFTQKKSSQNQGKTIELNPEEEFEPVFESFLTFLYGYPIEICKENMWLYYFMADIYSIDDLTKACAAYVRESLQVTKRKRPDGVALDPATWFTPEEVVDIYETFNVDVVKGYAATNLMARLESVEDETLVNLSKTCLCSMLNGDISMLSEKDLFLKALAWLGHNDKRAEHAEDVLSAIRFCHFTKPADIMEAQTNTFVSSSPHLVSLLAAGCHYKFMKRELNPEDFVKLPEFKKKQYANRRYRRPDANTRISGTPPSSSTST